MYRDTLHINYAIFCRIECLESCVHDVRNPTWVGPLRRAEIHAGFTVPLVVTYE